MFNINYNDTMIKAYIQGLSSHGNKQALIIQHFSIVEPILSDPEKYKAYYDTYRQRKNEVSFFFF